MEAILAILGSEYGKAAFSFLMSELPTGVSYLRALMDGDLTEDEVLEAWRRGASRFAAGEAAIEAALDSRQKQ